MDAKVRELAEAAAQPGGGVNPFDIIYFRPYLEAFFDRAQLDADLALLDAWVPANSDRLFVWHDLDRPPQSNALVAAIWGARRWEVEWQADSTFRPPPTVQRLAQIAVNIAITEIEAGPLFNQGARDQLRTRLHDPGGVWSLVHETEAVASLTAKGFRCEPHFLENSSRRELTLEWNDQAYPAQCKAKLPGAGRHIRRDLFVRLAASVAHDAKVAGLRRWVRIAAPDGIQWRDIDPIRAAAAMLPERTLQPVIVAPTGGRTFVLISRPAEGMITREDAERMAEGWGYYATFALGDPTEDTNVQRLDVVVGVDAEPDGIPWGTIRGSVDDAANQLAGGAPGFALVHTFDPHGLWRFGEDLPPWLTVLLISKLAQYPQLLGIQISAEPAFGAPAFNGRSEARWVVKEGQLPEGIPIGVETS
jgi:hypothetical protein